MRVRVEFYADDHGIAIPRRVHFDGRKVDVLETVDRWHGPDYCYIKVGRLELRSIPFQLARPLSFNSKIPWRRTYLGVAHSGVAEGDAVAAER